MSRQCKDNKNITYHLLKHFDKYGYPDELPWVMNFLCKVSINDGHVNTMNQQDTLNQLWLKYNPTGCRSTRQEDNTMAKHGNDHVITGRAIIVWDGITKPETTKNGQPMVKPQYSLKLALQPGDPSVAEIDAICKTALQGSEFKGVMPHGGSWPLAAANPQIADGALNGMFTINPKTSNGDIAQKVYDMNGQVMNPMTYSHMLYPGAVVEVIVHAYAFNNVQKGIALGLDGIRIVDAQAPALNIGATMPASEVAAAFGAAPQAPGMFAGAPSGYQPPVAPGAPSGYQVPGAPPVFTPPAGPMPPITPAPDFLNPTGAGQFAPPPPPVAPQHQMTAAAQGATYEQLVAIGWNDQTLRQHGMMS